MNLLKYIVLSLVTSITFFLPISQESHIFLYQNLFNTKIFNDQIAISLFNLPIIATIGIIHNKRLFALLKVPLTKNKILKKNTSKYIKILIITSLLNTILFFLIPHPLKNKKALAISFIISSLFILLATNKKGMKKYNEITYFDSLCIGLSPLLTYIPSISLLLSNLFLCKIRKINKKNTLIISLFSNIPILFIKSIPKINFIINTPSMQLIFLLSCLISISISIKVYKYFQYLYEKDKLYKLSIYCLLLAIFILIWYR